MAFAKLGRGGGFSERSVKAKPLDFFSKAPFKQFLINSGIFKNLKKNLFRKAKLQPRGGGVSDLGTENKPINLSQG